MRFRNPGIISFVAGMILMLFAGHVFSEGPAQLKGRIVGEKCAQLGKIGECYLKWAEPMVFWTEEGDYYAIDLSAKSGVAQKKLDEAFGQEVEAQGEILKNGKIERLRVAQLKILRPPAGKEFFKG
ncbi:MAG: hypothetical protein A2Z44_11640 [Betaproteobacteria bacterium RBG_19FT_COMBO_58_11]|nr:MAG: hypothetical protein A2Z44_11640 [Betaproteobacteria bacterium RBG_19FT_COMBO_58_11]